MKKIAKIFTTLLTLCLLCGVILSVVASAANDDVAPPLNITGHSNNMNWNHENDVAATWTNLTAKNGRDFGIKEASNGNHYFYATVLEGSTSNNSSSNQITINKALAADVTFVTLDMDFGTDRYIYDSDGDGKFDTYADQPVEGYECIPAYGYNQANYLTSDSESVKNSRNQSFWFRTRFRGGTTTVDFPYTYIGFDTDTHRYYLHSSAVDTVTRAYLSNEVGVFDHVTKVYKIEAVEGNSSAHNVTEYVYVNGELFWANEKQISGDLKVYYFQTQTYGTKWAADKGLLYAYAFDNIALNIYDGGYEFAAENGLDEFDLTQPIYNCADVVYTPDYPNLTPYVHIGESGAKLYDTVEVNKALASIKDGDTVYTTRHILDFTPPEDVERFELVFPAGSVTKFTLSSEASKKYKVEESIFGYEVIKLGLDANDKMTTIQWLDADNNLLMQENLPVGVTPAYSPVTINTFDLENKTITKFSVEAWMWDIDGEGNELLNRDPMAIRALTGEEIDLANQYCNGVIKIYPVGVTEKETVDMAYIILNGDSVVLDTAKSYLAYEDSSTLAAQLSAAPNGALAILYKDASVANTVSVSANKNISIDLNGNTVTVSAAKAFNIAASSSVNLYTSVPNAAFIAPALFDSETAPGELVIGANCYFAEKLSDYKAVKLADNVIAAIAGTDVHGEIATVTLNLQDYVAEDFALVVWKDVLGNDFAQEYYHKSYTFVSHPTREDMNDIQKFPKAAEGDSGWFDIGYTDWKSATEGVDSQTLVMGETNVFVPKFGPVPYFDIKVNASIRYTDVSINICLPVPAAEGKVVFDADTGVYMIGEDDAREYVALSEITIDGEQYYVINLPISLDSFDTPTVFVEFGVLGFADEPVMLEKEISFNFMTYAESIAEVYACGSDDAKVVFDLVLYKYEAYLNAVGEDADAELVERVESFLEGHGDSGCACITDLDAVEFSEDELLATLLGDEALAEKILYAGFEVDTDRPYLYFYLPEDVEVKSFTVTHFGLEHMLGGWEYINNKVTADLTYAGTAEYNGQTCNVYQYADMMLCNAASIMNIKLDVIAIPASDDIFEVVEVYEGQFSLAAYINGLSESDAEIAPLAKALYVASKSAYEYRIVREDEVE